MKTVWVLTINEYEDPLEVLRIFNTEKLGLKIFTEKLEEYKLLYPNRKFVYDSPTYAMIVEIGISIILTEYDLEEENKNE